MLVKSIYFNLSISLVVIFLIVLVKITTTSASECNDVHRSKRQLLYPNSTLLQLNIGVGTPSPVKQVNVNWAIQANFQLPWNRTQIPVDILHANTGYDGEARKRRDIEGYVNDARLYHFYKYVEDILNGFGQNGTSCVLQMLCRLGAEPLHSESNDDLLHEIASFVLNPLNDVNEDTARESVPYITAYNEGVSGHDCTYRCAYSLIDLFSQLH